MTKTRIDYTLFYGSRYPDEKPFLSIATMVWDEDTNKALYWHEETIDSEEVGLKKLWRTWREFSADGKLQQVGGLDEYSYKAMTVVKRW